MVQCENCFCLDACREHYRVSESGIRKGNGCGCFVDRTKYIKVVHGRWIVLGQRTYGGGRCYTHYCSECGQHGFDDYKACPNCFAKMDGDDNG